jgi:hypothetical protein
VATCSSATSTSSTSTSSATTECKSGPVTQGIRWQ